MRLWLNFTVYPFFSLLLGQPIDCQTFDRQVTVLQYHVKLAREPGAFIEIRRDRVMAFVKGIPVKSFPIQHSGFPWGPAPRLSRVASIMPPAPVLRVVVNMDEGRPSDTVSALEDIVSAEDMPDSFSITLANGALFYVTASPAVAFRLLRRPVNFCVLQMDPDSAQHLFWLLRADMGVIY